MKNVSYSRQDLPTGGVERRRKPRVQCSYPARIYSIEENNSPSSEMQAVLTNMSADGFYLLTKHPIDIGQGVQVDVRMSNAPLDIEQVPRISARGQVLRVETNPGGGYGLAVQLHSHRFPL